MSELSSGPQDRDLKDDPNRFLIHTFGCKVNTYDSGLLQKRLLAENYQSDSEKPEIHILNTCAVTAQATREAVRCARRLKASDPNCTVVVTGCSAQVDTDEFKDLSGVDLVIANSHKGDLENLLRQHLKESKGEEAKDLSQAESQSRSPKVYKSNIFRKLDLEAGGGLELGHTRSFLKIQDGCNSFCTYCVIPFGRGRSRSIETVDLIRRIDELYAQGSREVVLTGVHIGDYEDSSGNRLDDLVEEVLLKTKMPRIRLTSLEPVELTPKLFELYEDTRLCRHFHMSIQSACTSVLKNMRRNYTAEEVEWSLQAIHKRLPGSFVGMDVIVGFPQESEKDFLETYERLESLPWTRVHVFPYSERPGTKAERLEGKIGGAELKRRAKVLRQLSTKRFNQSALRQVGSVKSVMRLDSKEKSGVRALSEDYWQVSLEEGSHLPKDRLFNVKISGVELAPGGLAEHRLLGQLL